MNFNILWKTYSFFRFSNRPVLLQFFYFAIYMYFISQSKIFFPFCVCTFVTFFSYFPNKTLFYCSFLYFKLSFLWLFTTCFSFFFFEFVFSFFSTHLLLQFILLWKHFRLKSSLVVRINMSYKKKPRRIRRFLLFHCLIFLFFVSEFDVLFLFLTLFDLSLVNFYRTLDSWTKAYRLSRGQMFTRWKPYSPHG